MEILNETRGLFSLENQIVGEYSWNLSTEYRKSWTYKISYTSRQDVKFIKMLKHDNEYKYGDNLKDYKCGNTN